MLSPLAGTLTTFVLHWDRTSVPFDRIPHDDGYGCGYDDPNGDVSMYPSSSPAPRSSANPPSRTETFARRIAEQNPALRYALIKVLHDDPARPPPKAKATVPWSTPSATPMLACEPAAPLCESRFFRIERSEGWLCLDVLPAGAAEKVMEGVGLSFVDRVRYY